MHPYVALRDAVKRHHDWPADQTGAAVIDAAQRLVQTIDEQAAMIAYYRDHVTPTDEAVAKLLGTP